MGFPTTPRGFLCVRSKGHTWHYQVFERAVETPVTSSMGSLLLTGHRSPPTGGVPKETERPLPEEV